MLRWRFLFLVPLAVFVTALNLNAGGRYEITRDVVYGHKAGLAMTYDVIRHSEKSNEAAVVFVMSGGWFSAWVAPEVFVSPFAPAVFKHFRQMVDDGYTLFIVRHGSAPQFTVPDAVKDVKRALRHIRHNAQRFKIDADRIGICGGSAGGHLSLMLGTDADDGDPDSHDMIQRTSNRVAAVVAYFPPVDLRERTGPNKTFPGLDFDKDEAYSVSPLMHVSADDAPTLLIHGDSDKLVNVSNSQRIHEAFEAHNVTNKLIVIEGAGHGFVGAKAKQASRELVAWFEKYLAKKPE